MIHKPGYWQEIFEAMPDSKQPTDEEILAAYRGEMNSGRLDGTPNGVDFWPFLFRAGYLAGHSKGRKVEVRWERTNACLWHGYVGSMGVASVVQEDYWYCYGLLSGIVCINRFTSAAKAKAALTIAIETWFEGCLGDKDGQ